MTLVRATGADSSVGSIYFKGPRSPFSNLYRIEDGIDIWGHTFYSVEQAYQWRKAVLHNLHRRAERILTLTDPYRIKQEGSFKTNDNWEARKSSLMLDLLFLKLESCPQFICALRESFPKLLVEDTANEYWGRGPDNRGLNTLGCLLMHVRGTLI